MPLLSPCFPPLQLPHFCPGSCDSYISSPAACVCRMSRSRTNEVAESAIPGLWLCEEMLCPTQEKQLLARLAIDALGSPCLQIHPATEFGWSFLKGHARGMLSETERLAPIPDWLMNLWTACLSCLGSSPSVCSSSSKASLERSLAQMRRKPCDHVIVNDYVPGDGCLPHVDDVGFWDDWVLGVSLGSGCLMDFVSTTATTPTSPCLSDSHCSSISSPTVPTLVAREVARRESIWLPPRSMYLMSGDARWRFTHGISFAKHDILKSGETIPRGHRVSITFRSIASCFLPDSLREPCSASDVDADKSPCSCLSRKLRELRCFCCRGR